MVDSLKVHVVVVGPREMRYGRTVMDDRLPDHSLVRNGREVGNEPDLEQI